MKVLLLTPCGLPVPAVHGGAVATLTESIAKCNEVFKKIDLTIISSYDKEAVSKSSEYKKTDFIFIKEPFLIKALDVFIDRMISLFKGKKHFVPRRFLWKILAKNQIAKKLKTDCFDRVVFENATFFLKILKNKKLSAKYNGKLFFHLHNDIPQNVYVGGLLQCKVLSISNYLINGVLKLCGDSMKSNCYVLKNGVDTSIFNTNSISLNKISSTKKIFLNISEEKKVILFVGRITPYKGVGKLVEAFCSLDNNSKIELVIVGSTNFGKKQTSDFEEEIKKKVEKIDNAIMLGYVPQNDLPIFYKIADVVVLPSTWPEPAGLTMVESLMCGAPLITTNVGGIPEYIDGLDATILNNDDCLVENIRDSIVKIISNEPFYKQRAFNAGKKMLKNYSSESFYNSFVSLILD